MLLGKMRKCWIVGHSIAVQSDERKKRGPSAARSGKVASMRVPAL